MAENPLVTLARVVGGIALMRGTLGHQVLGQLVVMNAHEVAIAAATLVVAGATGERSAVGQIALRTIAPALAVRVLLNRQEERLDRKERRYEEHRQALDELRRRLKRRRRRLREQEARHAGRSLTRPTPASRRSSPDGGGS